MVGKKEDTVLYTVSDFRLTPTRAHIDDTGWDLKAGREILLAPGARRKVPTGLHLSLPPRHWAFVCPRSGLASKHGITVLNGPGVIDSGYLGEIGVVLHNTDKTTVPIPYAYRIAQLVICPNPWVPWRSVRAEDWPLVGRSDRGANGFGSSGG